MSIQGRVVLSHLGVLGVKGPEATSFLQGQVTCHMEEVTLSQSRLGGHCNLKGRLESLFQMVLIEESPEPLYGLIMVREMVPYALKQFKKYALFSKVSFSDLSELMPVLGLFTLSLPPSLEPENYTICQTADLTSRYQILCHSKEDLEKLHETLHAEYPLLPLTDWEQWDINHKIPALYPQTIDCFLPHHINVVDLNGVSFTKGCYLGQEIIARMHYKGKIKKHLYQATLQSEDIPQPGDPIQVEGASSREAPGIIVRASRNNDHVTLLMVLEEEDSNKSLYWKNYPLTVSGRI